ncbi:hypothetical protein RSal33209_0137 [Renibacterium salmoninarum ATCC 33209]|uniref:Uncharacterized protein n=1 Tax=Renibacterium salmoninarum (strain ATCC 33209 / DSM 20767 / JCM 11484 / NBRC 15589 / NCIMB 2235) TaxID=288705 RepID=A9WL60_RENSM|nr:hypothetical protein RSal33209_0137 [Renibacterium salmoninarum ATCC 33209]
MHCIPPAAVGIASIVSSVEVLGGRIRIAWTVIKSLSRPRYGSF